MSLRIINLNLENSFWLIIIICSACKTRPVSCFDAPKLRNGTTHESSVTVVGMNYELLNKKKFFGKNLVAFTCSKDEIALQN